MTGKAVLLHVEPGFSLPVFERFAPPPPPGLVAARIDAHSAPGDVVLDLAGRGGWIARAAIDRRRTAVSFEATPLDRLLAEVVLRPPDLRHLDAAVQALGGSPRRESSLKASITDLYASRCATCGRPVTLDELAWEVFDPADPAAADAMAIEVAGRRARPVRRQYRCPVCRDQLGGGELRQAPLELVDVERALDERDYEETRARLRERFPVLEGGALLPDELLDLHTPRQLVALAAILQRIEGDLRAAPIEAALRLAFLHALGPSSRLASSPGRLAALRIAHGHVRQPSGTHWRERNPWLAFENGVRTVRTFVQRLESGAYGPVPARLGEDLRSLGESAASVVLRVASPAAYAALELEATHLARSPLLPRVRLILTSPPPRPSADRLAWMYHASAWAIGRDAAASIPLEPLFGPAGRASAAWQSVALARALRSVEPALAREGRAVILLDPDGPEALVGAALAGVSAGYRVASARLGEAGDEFGGTVELVPPRSTAVPGGPRTRANVALDPEPGGAGDPDVRRPAGLFAAPERVPDAPFSAQEAARSVVETAVEVLKVRGEPMAMDALLGEVIVGLDRHGHLRRLVRSATEPESDSGPADLQPSSDLVERVLALVRGELANGRQRLVAMDGDRWWLADRADRDAAAVPLADRVEWAVYSLLSTAGPLSEAAFFERIASLFAGPDLPDEALVRACLDSYRGLASTADRLVTGDDLLRRSQEHGAVLAQLAELGHRLGFSVWLGARQLSRRLDGVPLAHLLSERELAGPPYLGRARPEDLEDVDAIWYVRGRLGLLWEVEWTAMLSETVLRRHGRIPPDDRLTRLLVVLPERVELIRHKLERSPLLREALEAGPWSIIKAPHLRSFAALERPSLADLEPYLGLDPLVERTGEQLGLF